jgi:signal transduction histidine kinase
VTSSKDPFYLYRLKVVRFGLEFVLLSLAAVVLFRLLPGHGEIHDRPFLLILGVAILALPVVFKAPWRRLLEDGSGLRVIYAWSAGDILLITAGIGVTGGGRSELFLLYALTIAFFGTSLPRRGQLTLVAFITACYVGVVALTGWDITPAVLVFRLAIGMILAFFIAFMSRELMQEIAGHHEARRESDRRSSLLASVAIAARGMSALDPNQVLEAVVKAANDLGFESTAVGLYDESGNYRTVRSRFVPDALVERPVPAGEGIVGQVWKERRTVVVHEYSSQSWALPEMKAAGIELAVATPVWSQGNLAAALVCASSRRQKLGAQEVEAIEMLAAQTGAALYIARRFEDEHRSVERLAELDRLKSDFLSNVSHELRTPLTVIIGNGRTLSTGWRDLDDELKLELLGRLNANALSLNAIITTLLDFSRLEAGHVTLRTEPFDLGAQLEAIVARLSSLFVQHPLTTEIDQGLEARADSPLIDRVVENLLVNATKHTPPGTHVTLVARVDGDTATVEVRDTGPGIMPQDLPHLGERFFRGRTLGIARSSGTGLGLALARELLSLHGSALSISSRLGEGSRFSFTLPMAGGGTGDHPEITPTTSLSTQTRA